MKRKSAIMQMHYCERGSYEDVPCSNEYFKLLDEYVKNDSEIRVKLSEFPNLLELYKKANDSLEILNCESEDNHYLEGFRFGVLIGLDIATDTKNEDT